ncbi:hypothetical protein, variant [Phialophora macrospora]|uniref:Amidase domain-containing protein n=1 Tax=Phialophora macrospora TaxID=1851006 RepID=A0A0D2F5X3_9EURO|nr:hypothetical protein PV04_10168 [Phialophora macrospora]KIW63314.1 hypothetical protein, variant [Phialophora macrospora]
MAWQQVAAKAQAEVRASIPEKWRLAPSVKYDKPDATAIVQNCGILTPRQLEITSLGVTELVTRMKQRTLTAVETTEAFCARAAIAHQLVNCLTAFFPDEALKTAAVVDETYAQTGELVGPLHGVPVAVKDMYVLRGHKATFGYISFYERPPAQEDGVLVKVVKDAGAVIFGMTTMPQTGMALETNSNLWGRTLNPFNPRFGSGGSSGGDGALVALHGAPCSPLSSDIGGSIRAPAAFNGLYGIRPTSARPPHGGFVSVTSGNISIGISIGPCCHSLSDLKLITKQLVTHPTLPNEPSCGPPIWREIPTKPTKLRVGLLLRDGVVEPHPPVIRALLHTADKLRAAGHDVFEFHLPFDSWEVALTTWPLYFQTGGKEMNATMASTGEPPIPAFQANIDVFKPKELTVPELWKLNTQSATYKHLLSQAWDRTAASDLTSGDMMDVILCPSAALAGAPHDFPQWWGYTAMWNLLDYPSVILPVKDFKIDPTIDLKDAAYEPKDNFYDRKNWEAYDPELWITQPMTVQIVGRPWRDEEMISACETVDSVINPS